MLINQNMSRAIHRGQKRKFNNIVKNNFRNSSSDSTPLKRPNNNWSQSKPSIMCHACKKPGHRWRQCRNKEAVAALAKTPGFQLILAEEESSNTSIHNLIIVYNTTIDQCLINTANTLEVPYILDSGCTRTSLRQSNLFDNR